MLHEPDAILLLGNNPTDQHPALAWNLRSNVRLNRSRIYIANHSEIKLRRQAKAFIEIPQDGYASLVQYLGGNDGAMSRAADGAVERAHQAAAQRPSLGEGVESGADLPSAEGRLP